MLSSFLETWKALLYMNYDYPQDMVGISDANIELDEAISSFEEKLSSLDPELNKYKFDLELISQTMVIAHSTLRDCCLFPTSVDSLQHHLITLEDAMVLNHRKRVNQCLEQFLLCLTTSENEAKASEMFNEELEQYMTLLQSYQGEEIPISVDYIQGLLSDKTLRKPSNLAITSSSGETYFIPRDPYWDLFRVNLILIDKKTVVDMNSDNKPVVDPESMDYTNLMVKGVYERYLSHLNGDILLMQAICTLITQASSVDVITRIGEKFKNEDLKIYPFIRPYIVKEIDTRQVSDNGEEMLIIRNYAISGLDCLHEMADRDLYREHFLYMVSEIRIEKEALRNYTVGPHTTGKNIISKCFPTQEQAIKDMQSCFLKEDNKQSPVSDNRPESK